MTGQGSLCYRNATKNRTQVAPVLKAKTTRRVGTADVQSRVNATTLCFIWGWNGNAHWTEDSIFAA